MEIEANVRKRAAVHAALADPLRLTIAESLLESDRSPTELAGIWQVPTNLLAHHLAALVAAGLVQRLPSEADRRRTYLRLTALGRTSVRSPTPIPARRVVFVCTHNSARSQFAEGLWRRRSGVPVCSGGTQPADRVHPRAARVASRHGLDLSGSRPKLLSETPSTDDLVVTVCDNADQDLVPRGVPHRHWSIPDPVAAGTRAAFETAFTRADQMVEILSNVVVPREFTESREVAP